MINSFLADLLADLLAIMAVIYYTLVYKLPNSVNLFLSRKYYKHRYRTVEDAAKHILEKSK